MRARFLVPVILLLALLVSACGDDEQDTTVPEVDVTPPEDVVDLSTNQVTSTSIELAWTSPGDDDWTGQAMVYDLRISQSLITDANFESANSATDVARPIAGGHLERYTFGGLTPRTTYYFAIKTADEAANWSGLSNVHSEMTHQPPDLTPPAEVIDLAVGEVTASSVSLRWTAPGDNGNSGTAFGYDLRYAPWPISDLNWADAEVLDPGPIPQPAGSIESATVAGLEPETLYYFGLRTADEAGNRSGTSNVVSVETPSFPVPPSTPQAVLENLRSAYLTRDLGLLSEGFDTVFYSFLFAPEDVGGEEPLPRSWSWDEERVATRNLFESPNVVSIRLDYTIGEPTEPSVIDLPPPSAVWKVEITEVNLSIRIQNDQAEDQVLQVENGSAEFYFRPVEDAPEAWVIVEWRDHHPFGQGDTSWGLIKNAYR